jgi:hypothetical protein
MSLGPNNSDRASWAQTAVDAFQDVCRTDDCDAIADLMVNLLHLAREEGLDPLKIHAGALMNFEAEEEEEAIDND